MLFLEIKSQVPDSAEPIIWNSEISEKVKKILRVFTDTPSVSIDAISYKTGLSDHDIHSIAVDLAMSEQRGTFS